MLNPIQSGCVIDGMHAYMYMYINIYMLFEFPNYICSFPKVYIFKIIIGDSVSCLRPFHHSSQHTLNEDIRRYLCHVGVIHAGFISDKGGGWAKGTI